VQHDPEFGFFVTVTGSCPWRVVGECLLKSCQEEGRKREEEREEKERKEGKRKKGKRAVE